MTVAAVSYDWRNPPILQEFRALPDDAARAAWLIRKTREWRKDYELFASECLHIQDKKGRIIPFRFNGAQKALHDAIEKQRAEVGYVRVVALKGRQMGFSTYSSGRAYWRSIFFRGRRVLLLAHEKSTTQNLFAMVRRFQTCNPFPPVTGKDSAQGLDFPDQMSEYYLATAGNQNAGRGGTINTFLGSEVAYWEGGEAILDSALQSIALDEGTEIILESTSNGPMGFFYQKHRDASRGDDEIFRAVFTPWHMAKEYAKTPPANFVIQDGPSPYEDTGDEEPLTEVQVKERYGLTDAQVYWRRIKIQEVKSVLMFNRIYPSCEADAWADNNAESFIKADAIRRARERVGRVTPSGPLIIGVDPASGGGDRFSVARRRGNVVTKVESRRKIGFTEALEWLRYVIDNEGPDLVNIDLGNIGQSVVVSLRALGPKYAKVIRGVDFGSPSRKKLANKDLVGPVNRRAEMWGKAKDWLEDIESRAAIPDKDSLAADLMAPRQKFRPNNDWLLESKAEMRARGIPSTDEADAVVLTFANDIYVPEGREEKPLDTINGSSNVGEDAGNDSPGGWMI